jgi:hypothetical protein
MVGSSMPVVVAGVAAAAAAAAAGDLADSSSTGVSGATLGRPAGRRLSGEGSDEVWSDAKIKAAVKSCLDRVVCHVVTQVRCEDQLAATAVAAAYHSSSNQQQQQQQQQQLQQQLSDQAALPGLVTADQ